ncbi:SDR family oxidoreductase [Spiractinospora alimapuensis]|nr:SDR family oxidoreductase [Spiractinospora alimapuensis]
MRDLGGKVIVVTGGARGIGEATARQCVEAGARVLITDVLVDEGQATAERLGGAVEFHVHDVTREDDWQAVVHHAETTLGRIDGLVNNAGVSSGTLIQDTPLEDFERVVRINLVGVFLGLKAMLGPMGTVGGGSIVNLSSAAGLIGVPLTSGYGASKWGVRGLTKIAAEEFALYRIRVNSVHPGMIATPMTHEAGAIAADHEYPLAPEGRVGKPEEVAAANVFLLSDGASYVTGAELAVDGGWSAGEVAMLAEGPQP